MKWVGLAILLVCAIVYGILCLFIKAINEADKAAEEMDG